MSPLNVPPSRPQTGLRRFSGTLDALARNLSNTGRSRKQAFGMATDAGLTIVSLWLAYSLRHGMPFSDFRSTWHLFLLLPAGTVLAFAALGIYRWVVRSTNARLFRQIVKGCIVSSLTLVLVTFLLPPDRANPRSLFVIYGVLLVLGACGVRVLWQGWFDAGRRGEPVAIYGAGSGGRQLASLLEQGTKYRPVLFIDDNAAISRSTVYGLPVLYGGREDLGTVLRRHDVCRLILAIPSLGPSEYQKLVQQLEVLELPVQTMPAVNELMSGAASVDEIRDLSIGDILGRTEVAPNRDLIGRRITGRTVLITGGGGSIGAELCRQISRLVPACLIVLDVSEENLYHITEEISGLDIEFLPRLQSVTDRPRLEQLMREHEVDTIYHAAAYKHVPIIEAQPDQGVDTNIFGTLALLEVAIAHSVSDFVLISTDKAVRPTNAMGASKRVAEMILQAKARTGSRTRISMVRFGNVLGSSGSVVPKFSKQIQAGGPVTLTHPEITRYFMTIPEAAQLVLQASAIAKGGDVFVLDMGEPMKIIDLARTMVRLYGKRLREETADANDIAIEFKGLRPGEKMYEELFITASHRATEIKKVFTADEAHLHWEILRVKLEELRSTIVCSDEKKLRTMLMALASFDQNLDRGLDSVQTKRKETSGATVE